MPALRDSAEQQNAYFDNCLKSGMVESIDNISDERRIQLNEWINDENVLLRQSIYQIGVEEGFASIPDEATDEEKIALWPGGPLPPIHKYRVDYHTEQGVLLDEDEFDPSTWQKITERAEVIKQGYIKSLVSGIDDNRTPLEPAREARFRKCLADFNSDEHPDEIPQTFAEAQCTVFGHICPVFFAAEEIKETEEARRLGRRHLNFQTMIRIVRRDDYRCQHCFKQLLDNELEFDHKIPVAKGGSSEEHNIRLTCFDCNRDKSDKYIP